MKEPMSKVTTIHCRLLIPGEWPVSASRNQTFQWTIPPDVARRLRWLLWGRNRRAIPPLKKMLKAKI
jgi:hypothetical protein